MSVLGQALGQQKPKKRKLEIDLSQVPSGMELRARSWKENSDA